MLDPNFATLAGLLGFFALVIVALVAIAREQKKVAKKAIEKLGKPKK